MADKDNVVTIWKKIDSAPRDGTEILGYSPDSGDLEFYRFYDGRWFSRGDYCEPTNSLTHWVILENPTVDVSQEGEAVLPLL